MSDNGGAPGLGGAVAEPQGKEYLTDQVCPFCRLFKVCWGKMVFCPRCDRPNGSGKPGRKKGFTRHPRAGSPLY